MTVVTVPVSETTVADRPRTRGLPASSGATVRAVGRDPKPRRFDLLIAAVAVALGIPLITGNEAGFAGIHDTLTVIAV